MNTNDNAKLPKRDGRNSTTNIVNDLKRHVCSLMVLGYHYQSPLPHLLSPGLAEVNALFLKFGREIRSDVSEMTQHIRDLGGTPVKRVQDIEAGSYLPLFVGGGFVLWESIEAQRRAEQRLSKLLGHSARLARKLGVSASSDLVCNVLIRSEARERALRSLSL